MRPNVGLVSASAVAIALCAAAPAAAAVPGPCQLVTSANAAKALGVSVVIGKTETIGGSHECLYFGSRGTVVVAERQQSRSDFDKVAKKDPGPVVHVAGIGSDAYSINHASTLLLWKNGTEVTLVATGGLKTEESLGKTAAGRL